MSKKTTREESELFRRSIGPVRPLRHDRIEPAAKRRPPRLRAGRGGEHHTPLPGLSEGPVTREFSAADRLEFARPGVQQRQLQRLRRGRFPVVAELDLHGLGIVEARHEVVRFVSVCLERRIRSVRIIHGKGYGSRETAPVLKNCLYTWLCQHHDVLAFCSSPPEHGGTGAVNVLLRSRQ
ncbi:MAG: Smr/MutS family protein [Gammaproteobacteria bacterium]